jgi:hypothetical protein
MPFNEELSSKAGRKTGSSVRRRLALRRHQSSK